MTSARERLAAVGGLLVGLGAAASCGASSVPAAPASGTARGPDPIPAPSGAADATPPPRARDPAGDAGAETRPIDLPTPSPDGGGAAASGRIAGVVTTTPTKIAPQVVVYLEDAPRDGGDPAEARIDQHRLRFLPLVTVVPAGAKVTFLNSDPFPHSVYSPSGERFDLGVWPGGQARSRRFEKAGAYTILCSLHPEMIAYVVATPSRHFARPGQDGRFAMDGVPAGTWRIAAWGPQLAPATQSVTVAGGAEATVRFDLGRAK